MRLVTAAIALALTTTATRAEECKLTPKQVVSNFMDEFYIQKKVRSSFGREAAIGFLEKFVADNPGQRTTIHRIIADGNLVAVHSHGWMENGDAAAKRGFAVVDIFRVEGCRVMEDWDVLSPVPETAANANTMF